MIVALSIHALISLFLALFLLPRGKLGESVYGKGGGGGREGEKGGVDYRKMYITKCMGARWHISVSPVILNGHNGIYSFLTSFYLF